MELSRVAAPACAVWLGGLVTLGSVGCSGGADAAEALRGSTVTVAEAEATYPTVALDADAGIAYVAWIAEGEGGPNVLLARVLEDGAVERPVRVNDRPGATAHEQAPPQVRVGEEGVVHVVWQSTYQVPGRRFPASDLQYARSEDGGRSFTPAIYVNDDAGEIPASHTFHDLVVGADGTVWVSWIDGRERARAEAELAGAAAAEARRREAESRVHGHSYGHREQAEDDLPSSEVRVAALALNGAAFGPSTTVADEVCPCCRTSLALAADGSLYLAWRRVFPGDIRDVVVARSEDGGRTFSEPVRVAEDGWHIAACPHAGPSVAVDSEGAVHVAWYTGREGAEGIYHVISRDGGRTFGSRRPLARDAGPAPALVRLASDGASAGVWAVWDDPRAEPPRLRFSRLTDGGKSRTVRTDPAPGFAPAMDVRSGLVAVAWLDEDALRLRLAAAESGGAP